MNDKPVGFIVALPIMVGCCLGLPLLVGWIAAGSVFAWLADNIFAAIAVVVIVPAVVYLLHRDRKQRRHLRASNEQAVGHPITDDTRPSATPRQGRSPAK